MRLCAFAVNSDLCFLLYFSKQCSLGKNQGKFERNRSSTFTFKESPSQADISFNFKKFIH